jgi:hypothetical protein
VIADIESHVVLIAAKMEVNGQLHVQSALLFRMNHVVYRTPDKGVFEKRRIFFIPAEDGKHISRSLCP